MIPPNQLHGLRLLMQLGHNLTTMQASLRENAAAWKAEASVRTRPVETLATWVTDSVRQYRHLLGHAGRLKSANPHLWMRTMAAYEGMSGTEAEVEQMHQALSEAIDKVDGAPKATYEQISAIADGLLGQINAPPSLWPE